MPQMKPILFNTEMVKENLEGRKTATRRVVKPILFNTEMVKAVLAGTKTVTRRVIRPQFPTYQDREPGHFTRIEPYGRSAFIATHEERPNMRTIINPPYLSGDILYVRETWSKRLSNECYAQPCHGGVCPYESCESTEGPCFPKEYIYKATDSLPSYGGKWHPSIHMPKEAARLFLLVTDVKVEHLQDITVDGIQREGLLPTGYLTQYSVMTSDCFEMWKTLWDSTIKPGDLGHYGWAANPWVWVYEFERCEKP